MSPVVGAGELLFDRLLSGRVPGGAPANFAFHCRQLGAPAAVVSRVGPDEPGDALVAWLTECGIATHALQRDPSRPTGSVAVDLGESGVPSYTIATGVAWDQIEWTPQSAALCASAAAIATGTLARRGASRAAIEAMVAACPGVRYFDVNLRAGHVDAGMLDAAFAGATVAKLTSDELATLRLTPAGLTARYANLWAVVVTRGAGGAEWHGRAGLVAEEPGLAVEVVDTIGAGDAFGAAVVVGLLRDLLPAQILRGANRYAAEVCRHAGGTPRFAWP